MSLLTGLESHWKLNEAASIDNAVDYGAAGNTLTEVNEPDPNVDIGGSRHVTLADNQYFTLADNASVSTGNIAFTFAGHFKFEALTSETDLITKRDQPVTGNVEYLMVANPTKFAWGTGDAVGGLDAITSTDLDIVTGTLYLVFAWHDPATSKIYIQVFGGSNTAVIDSVTRVTIPANGTAPLRLSNGTSLGLTGLMSKISFWKRVLTDAERIWLWNSGALRDFSEFASSPSSGAGGPSPYFTRRANSMSGGLITMGI